MIPEWHMYFMNMLPAIASRSKDPDTQIGCLIVGTDKGIRTSGYNSFPRGIRDDVPERFIRPVKYRWMHHAERSAMDAAARTGVALLGSTMYISRIPCINCEPGVVNVGIREVIYDSCAQAKWITTTPQYAEDYIDVTTMFTEAGILLTGWDSFLNQTNP